MQKFKEISSGVIFLFFIALIVYFIISAGIEAFDSMTVTNINVMSGVLIMFIGGPIFIAGAMVNDSGRGGFFISVFQFLSLSYILVFIIGIISSISFLYTDLDNKIFIAKCLASASIINLLALISFFTGSIAIEMIVDAWMDRN